MNLTFKKDFILSDCTVLQGTYIAKKASISIGEKGKKKIINGFFFFYMIFMSTKQIEKNDKIIVINLREEDV
jgi:hypothetical protein